MTPKPSGRRRALWLPFCVLCLLLTLQPAAAQFDGLMGKPTNQASKRDSGSAGVLTGRVLLVHLYVAAPQSSWDGIDHREVRRRMRAALRFVRREAERYERQVKFLKVEMHAKYDKVIPTELGADPDWTQQVVKMVAEETPNALVDRLRREHKADHVLLVFHVNKSARSHNLTYSDGIDEAYRAERVVCFTRYETDAETAAATYAHEILHGFGAGELYFPYDKSKVRARLAGRMFARDVMYRVEYQLDELEIGPYTAYRIGWLDTLKEEYRVYEDPH
jgi:hypothetical protein